MSKLVVVVGAAGSQGGAVVSALLQDTTFKIRGLTRDINSKGAEALVAQGVEVVAADANNEESLINAFKGAYAIYAMTNFFEPFVTEGPEKAIEVEYQQGLNLARAASKTSSLKHYIWSTLPDTMALSNGQLAVPHFVAKARVDEFIKRDKALLSKTVFLWITFYANNLYYPIFMPIDAVSARLDFLFLASLLTNCYLINLLENTSLRSLLHQQLESRLSVLYQISVLPSIPSSRSPSQLPAQTLRAQFLPDIFI
jgi:hypothetical protein